MVADAYGYRVAYGVCVGSWDKASRFVLPWLEGAPRSLYTLDNQTSITEAYNEILAAYRHSKLDALILLHDDLEILDPFAEQKFLKVLDEPDVALAGVAGGSGRNGLAWWNQNPIGHQRTNIMNIDFGTRTGDVDLLEGSLLVLSSWAIRNLRFDARFTGFHGYDEIGMQARHQQKRCVVVDVDTHHHSDMGFKSEASYGEWLTADRLYREKWDL